jgi:hypothetical protein
MRIEDRWFIQLTARMEKEVLIRVWKMRRMEALGRPAMPAQGIKPGGRHDPFI